jgi:hypothetical protein
MRGKQKKNRLTFAKKWRRDGKSLFHEFSSFSYFFVVVFGI